MESDDNIFSNLPPNPRASRIVPASMTLTRQPWMQPVKAAFPANDPRGPEGFTTYHGSPYEFGRFSNESISSGEGNQAQGYGHYTAGDPTTAQGYTQSAPIKRGSPGYMYQVKIHADPSRLLDWDTPIDQQPIYEGLRKLGLAPAPPMAEVDPNKPYIDLPSGPTGKELYDQLYERFGGFEEASNALSQAGVPGIKYGASGGRTNYVTFDPATLEVLRRWQNAPPTPGQTLNSMPMTGPQLVTRPGSGAFTLEQQILQQAREGYGQPQD